jgi:hypothetical protein
LKCYNKDAEWGGSSGDEEEEEEEEPSHDEEEGGLAGEGIWKQMKSAEFNLYVYVEGGGKREEMKEMKERLK